MGWLRNWLAGKQPPRDYLPAVQGLAGMMFLVYPIHGGYILRTEDPNCSPMLEFVASEADLVNRIIAARARMKLGV